MASLGVENRDPIAQVRTRYLQLCQQFHPDRNVHHSAKGRFVEIQSAYEQLRLMKTLPPSPPSQPKRSKGERHLLSPWDRLDQAKYYTRHEQMERRSAQTIKEERRALILNLGLSVGTSVAIYWLFYHER